MDAIWNLENTNFSSISLRTPKPIQGGTFYARLVDDKNNPLLIQTPKCHTKNGIHKTGKKIYTDLKINTDNNVFIEWIKNLESHVKNIIFDKRQLWFHDEPSLDEIDYFWNSSLRTSKDNYLCRAFISKFKNNEQIQIWNENDEEMTLDDINSEDQILSIIEVGGLKFTSQSFQLELYLRQLVIIKPKPIFSKCLIKFNKSEPNKIIQGNDTVDGGGSINVIENISHTDENSDSIIEEPENKEITQDNKDEEVIDKNEIDTSMNQDDTNNKALENLESNNIGELKPESTSEDSDVENSNENINEEKTENLNNEQREIKQEISNELLKSKKETNIDDNILQPLEKEKEDLQELDISLSDFDDENPIKLKTPKDVYLEIYKKAREKALMAKKEAIKAFLDAKKIKETYLLDEWGVDSSDEEDILNYEEYE